MYSSRLFATLVGVLLLSGPTMAQNHIVIDAVTSRSEAPRSRVSLSGIELVNTNLSREEVVTLLSADSPDGEIASIALKLTADSLKIGGVSIFAETARVMIGPVSAAGLDRGRFAQANLSDFSVVFADKDAVAAANLSGRSLELKRGNVASFLTALRTGHFESASLQVGEIKWDGFDAAFTDPETPADSPGGNQVKVRLRSLFAVTDYVGDMPVSVRGEAAGVLFDPAPASELGKGLRSFGYERIELGISGAGHYEPNSQRLVMQDYTISSPQAGRLSLAGEVSGVDAAALSSSDATRRGMALLGASVEGLKVGFANDGLVEKIFAFSAAQQGRTPAALRSEVSALAGQLLPLFLAGDPQSLPLAQSVQAFLSEPKNFTLTLKARGAPVPLARLGSIRDPMTFLALVNVKLVANQ